MRALGLGGTQKPGATGGAEMRKRILFIVNSLDTAYKFQQVLLELDAAVTAGSIAQIQKLRANGIVPDLIILETQDVELARLRDIEQLAADRGCPMLAVVGETDIERLSLGALQSYDFVMKDAGQVECLSRVRRLLGGGNPGEGVDVIAIGSMVINLATYQVTIAGDPVDLTYLEYALLVFFVQHAGYTFTREALLQNVWGFDYYGGPRTVDVHVRRIRSKLGPNLAQYLETVRGVGYLWNLV